MSSEEGPTTGTFLFSKPDRPYERRPSGQATRHHQNKENFTRLPNYQRLIPLITESRAKAEPCEIFPYGADISWNATFQHVKESSLDTFNDNGEYEDWGLTRLQITNQDAAYILGKAGRTKRKIMKIATCFINLTDDLILEVAGTERQRAVAVMLIQLIIQQRTNGQVTLDFESTDKPPSLTAFDLDQEVSSLITGMQIRNVETDWEVIIMNYVIPDDHSEEEMNDNDQIAKQEKLEEDVDDVEEVEEVVDENGDVTCREKPSRCPVDYISAPLEAKTEEKPKNQKLLIFGSQEQRRGAELKLMSTLEQKKKGYYTSSLREKIHQDVAGFHTDTLVIPEDDFSYALGKEGNTRKKLALASGCVLEYIGHWAFIAGNVEERKRGREYLRWLLVQRKGSVHVDTAERDDVLKYVAPTPHLREIFGPRGAGRALEKETATFCFINDRDHDVEYSLLLIFSYRMENRVSMKEKLQKMQAMMYPPPRMMPPHGYPPYGEPFPGDNMPHPMARHGGHPPPGYPPYQMAERFPPGVRDRGAPRGRRPTPCPGCYDGGCDMACDGYGPPMAYPPRHYERDEYPVDHRDRGQGYRGRPAYGSHGGGDQRRGDYPPAHGSPRRGPRGGRGGHDESKSDFWSTL